MTYLYSGKNEIDVNDGTGSLSYSASSCVSEDSSIGEEDSRYLSSFLEREQQLHVKEQKQARRCRSLRESPQRTGSVNANESSDSDAAYRKYCSIRNNDSVTG